MTVVIKNLFLQSLQLPPSLPMLSLGETLPDENPDVNLPPLDHPLEEVYTLLELDVLNH